MELTLVGELSGAPSVAETKSCEAGMQRARGRGQVSFERGDLKQLHQSGSAKILLPSSHGCAAEAVLVNTAGGMTGGDQFNWETSTSGGDLTVTTQAAERLYKSSGGVSNVQAQLSATGGGSLHWLPQELIVFDGGALERKIAAEVSSDSELLMVESMIFGRTAMKEQVRRAMLSDQWRVFRDGHLIHGEAFRMSDPERELSGLGAFDGAIAMATLLLVSLDAEDRLGAVRASLDAHEAVTGGASAWNGKLVVRLLGKDALALRRVLIHVLSDLRGHDLPKVWRL